MKRQILCVGTGGQGVIWLARVLGEAARSGGVSVISAETHGMAMRGGSVACHVKLGGFTSPLILPGRADLLLALDAAEGTRNGHYVVEGGRVVVNTQDPRNPDEVNALELARSADSPRGLNAALLGYAAGSRVLGFDDTVLRAAVETVSPEPHRMANLKAYDAGLAAAAGHGTEPGGEG